MKPNVGNAPPHFEQTGDIMQQIFELLHFIIDIQPQRQKCAGGGMMPHPFRTTQLCQLQRCLNGCTGSFFHNGASDCLGAPFVSVVTQNIGEILLRGMIHNLISGGSVFSHLHGERSIFLKGETARRLIQLHG